MTRFIAGIFLASALAGAPAAAQTAAMQVPTGAELTRSLAAVDADLFALFFLGCDPARLTTMVTADLEFYHDKGGVVATSGAAFVADYAKNCEARKAPDAWRSRRELVPETRRGGVEACPPHELRTPPGAVSAWPRSGPRRIRFPA